MKNSAKSQRKQQFRLEGITINKALMEKFLTKEKTKKINVIDDLSELNEYDNHIEHSEIFEEIEHKVREHYHLIDEDESNITTSPDSTNDKTKAD